MTTCKSQRAKFSTIHGLLYLFKNIFQHEKKLLILLIKWLEEVLAKWTGVATPPPQFPASGTQEIFDLRFRLPCIDISYIMS